MKNITLAIEERVLDEARVYAAKRRTTVNGLVREFLKRIVDEDQRRDRARRRLAELAERSTARIGPDYRWSREELYEDRLLPRHQRPDLRGGGEA